MPETAMKNLGDRAVQQQILVDAIRLLGHYLNGTTVTSFTFLRMQECEQTLCLLAGRLVAGRGNP